MEEYFQYKDLLLLRHEFYGGDVPKPKVNEARHKLLKKGQAVIVTEDHWLKPKSK